MVARNRARYLAPIALVAAIAGTYVIVSGGVDSKPATHSQTTGGSTHHARGRYARKRYYVVRPGDNLTIIAARTGVPVTTLELLNQKADPNSLQTGQRLLLRR